MKEFLKPYVLKLTLMVNVVFLIWHITLLAVFTEQQIWFMAGFNIFSVCIYSWTLYLLRHHETRGVIRMMYIELMLHMIVSVVCMGRYFGFLEYAFGILPIIMFDDYIAEKDRKQRSSIIMVLSVVVCYLGLSIWTMLEAPLYHFSSDTMGVVFRIANGTATVTMVGVYFLMFTHMVLGFEKELIRDASYDNLTGLANRRVFYEHREQLQKVENYCVFMLDVDNFKSINDTYGHDFGDKVLETMGELLEEWKHECDKLLALRWGGEEFVVIYCDPKLSREEKIIKMELLRRRVEQETVMVSGREMHFTVTIGASSEGEDDDVDALIALADSRMYLGKRQGKNRLIYTHDEWRKML